MAVIEFACLHIPSSADRNSNVFASLALFDQLKIQAKDCLYWRNGNIVFSILEQKDIHISVGGMEMGVYY